MDSLKDNVSEQIKAAMKAKDKTRLNVLRYLKKLFIENDTSNKPVAELDIVISHAKKMKDSLSLYQPETSAYTEIEAELSILDEFLPKALDESEVVSMIEDIKKSQANPNMGTIMKALSPQIKGRFDGKKATELVKTSLA